MSSNDPTHQPADIETAPTRVPAVGNASSDGKTTGREGGPPSSAPSIEPSGFRARLRSSRDLGAIRSTKRRAEPREVIAKYGALAAMVLTFVAFSVIKQGEFLTVTSVKSMLADMSPPLILALAATVVLASDQFDLSLGGMAGLLGAVSVLMVSTDKVGLPLVIALVLVLLCGSALGFVNGALVAFAGASSFVATLAMGSVYQGLEDTLLQNGSVYQGIPHSFTAITSSTTLGLSTQVFIAAGVLIFVYLLLGHTQLGRAVHAVGDNAEAARLSGVPVRWIRAIAFTLTGLLTGIAGILLASGSGAANPDAGIDYLLPAYAAAFLGSVMWRSGSFTAIGTLLGSLFLEFIATGLSLFSVSASIVLLVQGAILISAVLIARVGRSA